MFGVDGQRRMVGGAAAGRQVQAVAPGASSAADGAATKPPGVKLAGTLTGDRDGSTYGIPGTYLGGVKRGAKRGTHTIGG